MDVLNKLLLNEHSSVGIGTGCEFVIKNLDGFKEHVFILQEHIEVLKIVIEIFHPTVAVFERHDFGAILENIKINQIDFLPGQHGYL
ncbi:hypothetical protein D3C87_2020570 [compost metagenome]